MLPIQSIPLSSLTHFSITFNLKLCNFIRFPFIWMEESHRFQDAACEKWSFDSLEFRQTPTVRYFHSENMNRFQCISRTSSLNFQFSLRQGKQFYLDCVVHFLEINTFHTFHPAFNIVLLMIFCPRRYCALYTVCLFCKMLMPTW